MKVKGLTAIVTGGGSGMGAAVGRALSNAGAHVALFDINLHAAEAVAREIHALPVHCDVSDASSAAEAFARVHETYGPARIAINCAGVATPGKILGRDGPLDLASFRRVVEINLIGTFNITRLAANDMSQQEPLESGERGVIINTASIAAHEGQIGQAAYAASKGGVVSLTLPAARELARFGVRVMTIAPGLIETPMLLGFPKDVQESLASGVPFPKRFGHPEEFARLAMHIIDNQMLNGETIRLDGALRMDVK